MDLSRSTAVSGALTGPVPADALLGRPSPDTSPGSSTDTGSGIDTPAARRTLRIGLLRRRGSRVRGRTRQARLGILRRAGGQQRHAAGSGYATSANFVPSPLVSADLSDADAAANPMTIAFAEAAALLDRWDPDHPAQHPAQHPADQHAGHEDDTAEWTFDEPASVIDLSDNPKLIQHPNTIPGQRVSYENSAVPDDATPAGRRPADVTGAHPGDPSPAHANKATTHRPTTHRPSSQLPAAEVTTAHVTNPYLTEPILAAVLAGVASLAAWATLAPPSIWLPLAALPATGLIAIFAPGRDRARLLRAVALLAAGGVLPAISSAMTPVTLLIAVAAAATYPLLTSAPVARCIIAATAGSLLAPLVNEALRAGPAAFMDSLLDPASSAQTAVRIALTCGVIVVALIGMSAIATRRTLLATTRAAEAAVHAADAASAAERTATEMANRLGIEATRDQGTGLPNRQALLSRLTSLVGQHAADPRCDSGHPAGVAVIEIDRFMNLAGSLGTSAADALADQVGHRLRAGLPEHHLVARIARHQYAVLMLDATYDTCATLARAVTQLVSQPFGGAAITCSIGTVIEEVIEEVLDDDQLRRAPSAGQNGAGQNGAGQNAADLLNAADEALRAAQRSGLARWVMFDQAIRLRAQTQAGLENELREAIRTGAIGARYQPVLALGRSATGSGGDREPGLAFGGSGSSSDQPVLALGASASGGGDDREPVLALGASASKGGDDRIVGAEAIPEWTRADGSVVPAARFIAMADELGIGGQLGLHLLELGLDALLEWRAEGVGVDQVWVNLSPSQLGDSGLAHEVSARLAVRGLSAECLVLEVGAGELIETQQVMSTLSMLRALGIAIALDDFGRSGTSLTALRSLPISAVKIDRQLASELGRHDAVSRSIATLCHSLGLRVVVEGVETMVQLGGARAIGADAVQGYAIAGPMTAQDVTNLLSLRLPREFRLP